MKIEENISLKKYNTFGIDVKARFFVNVDSVPQLQKALKWKGQHKKFILSGGSNLLFTKDIEALIIRIGLKGISIEKETEDEVLIKVMAGENWHELVLWSLQQDFGGLENLSLIPGCAGTAPIQNIGAYGVELKDVFHSCEGMHRTTQEIRAFSKEDCQFGYRNSVFKNALKGHYVITSICLKLTKKNHVLNTSYGQIEDELKTMGILQPTIKHISKAVINIRQKKLPDPKKIGNSGSFFKNPVLNKKSFEEFHRNFPNAPFYKSENGSFKVPAGWLIDQSGFKGIRIGDAGVHKNQALVLVNHGKATGDEIHHLAIKIQEAVKDNFNILLTPEVNIIE